MRASRPSPRAVQGAVSEQQGNILEEVETHVGPGLVHDATVVTERGASAATGPKFDPIQPRDPVHRVHAENQLNAAIERGELTLFLLDRAPPKSSVCRMSLYSTPT